MHPIIQNQLQAIKDLCKQCKVKSLYSFGSVNTASFTEKSDIDLLIDFEPDISVEDYTIISSSYGNVWRVCLSVMLTL